MEWNIVVEWFYGVLEGSYEVEYCSGLVLWSLRGELWSGIL